MGMAVLGWVNWFRVVVVWSAVVMCEGLGGWLIKETGWGWIVLAVLMMGD